MSAITQTPSYSNALRQRSLAQDLLDCGLKLSLTKSLTFVPHSEVRKMYVEKWGEKPRPGKTPESVMHFINSDEDNLAITLASLVYISITDESSRYQIDPVAIIKAFHICKEILPDFRIDALFYCARDYKLREYHFLMCPKCSVPYISHNYDHTNIHCPCCSTAGALTLTKIRAMANAAATEMAKAAG